MSPGRSSKHAVCTALAACLAVATGCVTNPVTGRRELSLVSPEQELQIGREGYEAVLQEFGEYSHADLQAYVQKVGMKVAKVSHQPNLDWTFTLLDDPTVNAFAMPGGYIYVTRGILVALNSEAQLAGVLGHEVAHVTARHSASRITQQQLAGLGLGLASIFSETFRRYGGVAELALGLLFLRYGRADETEADELGMQYALRAGYDPRQIPLTYEMLERVGERDGQRLPTFLSTHPDPGDRREHTAELARRAVRGRSKAKLVVNAQGYNQRMNGVVYGQDPREGYFDGNRYFHPTLGFQVTFPVGWRYQDTRTAVMAVAPDESAGMQLTLVDPDGLSPAAYVAQLVARGDIVDADGDVEDIGGFSAWVGRIAAASEGQEPVALAAAFIRKADDQMFQFLGQSRDADEPLLFAGMRSFQGLTDLARLRARPARVQVAPAPTTGPFGQVVTGLGAPREFVGESALINNVDTNAPVAAGTLVKFIVPGKSDAPGRPPAPRSSGRAARSR